MPGLQTPSTTALSPARGACISPGRVRGCALLPPARWGSPRASGCGLGSCPRPSGPSHPPHGASPSCWSVCPRAARPLCCVPGTACCSLGRVLRFEEFLSTSWPLFHSKCIFLLVAWRRGPALSVPRGHQRPGSIRSTGSSPHALAAAHCPPALLHPFTFPRARPGGAERCGLQGPRGVPHLLPVAFAPCPLLQTRGS